MKKVLPHTSRSNLLIRKFYSREVIDITLMNAVSWLFALQCNNVASFRLVTEGGVRSTISLDGA